MIRINSSHSPVSSRHPPRHLRSTCRSFKFRRRPAAGCAARVRRRDRTLSQHLHPSRLLLSIPQHDQRRHKFIFRARSHADKTESRRRRRTRRGAAAARRRFANDHLRRTDRWLAATRRIVSLTKRILAYFVMRIAYPFCQQRNTQYAI